ncbi:MAG: putative D-alanyl-D-alanine dipeptidase [Verrucomicrobiales bacterium]|nr:putative D-alanyl-D-alanine dipeptidase [Verrucomicrobiales bacterium]
MRPAPPGPPLRLFHPADRGFPPAEITVMRFPAAILLLLLAALTGCRAMPAPLKLEPVKTDAIIAKAAAHDLVPVGKYDPSIRQDLRYSTTSNVFGRVLYPAGFPALATGPTAKKLAAANRALKPHGLRILVLDAYRPPEVQWQLFQMFRDDKFVADPRKKWSKHCYGCAVDITLTDLSGQEAAMPSTFDDFSKKAAARYTGTDPAIRRRITLLQKAMTDAGFSLYEDEWWHFNDLTRPALLNGPPTHGATIGLPSSN